MGDMVDVTGIDRKELLKALWENAKPAAFFMVYGTNSPSFDIDEAMRDVRHGRTYVDYACGRCIKSDVFTEKSEIDPRSYDREYGQGEFQKVVDSLKKK